MLQSSQLFNQFQETSSQKLNIHELMNLYCKNNKPGSLYNRARAYSDSDSMNDYDQSFTDSKNNRISDQPQGEDETECQHQNKQQHKYNYLCLDCGLIFEDYEAEERYVCLPKRNFFIPIRDKEIRDMIKHSTFEINCKDRIQKYIRQQQKQHHSQRRDLCLKQQPVIQIQQAIKKKQQIRDDVIQTAIKISNYVLDQIKVKGNNTYKLFIFVVQQMCLDNNIIITSKQLCIQLGFQLQSYTCWICGGQKIFQQFKYEIPKFTLLSNSQIIKEIQNTILVKSQIKQQIDTTQNDEQSNVTITNSQNKPDHIPDDNCKIISTNPKDYKRIIEILRNYELDTDFSSVLIFRLIEEQVDTFNLLFKHTSETKHKLIIVLLSYLNTILKHQQTNQLSDIEILNIIKEPMGFKQPFWKAFLTDTKLVQIPISKFKQMIKEFTSVKLSVVQQANFVYTQIVKQQQYDEVVYSSFQIKIKYIVEILQ